jgi:hypothetical protein
LTGITRIGVDEVLWQRGYKFLTVVYQIDNGCRRLLWVAQDRTHKTMLRFFRWFGRERSAALRWVCSDMWKPYLRVVAKKAGQALNVLDRFHIMAKMNKALDEVRAQEAKAMKAKGLKPVLTHSRWCLLKRPENHYFQGVEGKYQPIRWVGERHHAESIPFGGVERVPRGFRRVTPLGRQTHPPRGLHPRTALEPSWRLWSGNG